MTLSLAFYVHLPPEVEQRERGGRVRYVLLLQHGFCLKQNKAKQKKKEQEGSIMVLSYMLVLS